MYRGGPRHIAVILAVVFAAVLAALMPPCRLMAQNAAEKPASSNTNSAESPSEQTDTPNAAEAQPPPGAGGASSDLFIQDEPDASPADKPVEDGPGEANGPQKPAEQPANQAEADATPDAGTEGTPEGPSVAEAPVTGPAPEASQQPVPGEGAPLPGPRDAQPEGPSGAPPINGANTAESRPAGVTADNIAEGGGGVDEAGVAEPPEPEDLLPSPGQLAGEASEYQAPTITLSIPERDDPPKRTDPSVYIDPNRVYLETRPLPGPDVDETDEERLARDIERSLELLDLSVVPDDEEGIIVPLPSGEVRFKAADSFQFDRRNKVLKFTGNAELVFDDIAVWADLIEVDDGAATAYAKGYVALQQDDEIIFCDEAYLNYDTETVELFWVEGNSSGDKLEGNLFYEADRAWGTFKHLNMRNVKITTCDPFCGTGDEYYVTARRAMYKKDNSIVLHDAVVHVVNNPVAWVPMLAFPFPHEQRITEDETPIQQYYGYNNTEGMFAKFAYTYSARWVERVNSPLLGVAKLDLTQNLGPLVGVRQDFFIPAFGVTTVRAEYQRDWPESIATNVLGRKAENVNDSSNFTFDLSQELLISRALTGSLKFNRTNKLIASTSQSSTVLKRQNTTSSNFNLNYVKGDTNAKLGLTSRSDITGGYKSSANGTLVPKSESSTLTGDFTFSEKLSDQLTFNLKENYSSRKGQSRTGIPADQEGTFSMGLDWSGKQDTPAAGYKVKLNYLEQGIDFDQDSNTSDRNTGIRKERPRLTVTLPQDFYGEKSFFNGGTVNFESVVTGKRRTPEEAVKFQYSTDGSRTFNFSPASKLTTRLGFEQFFYDDGNAQYTLKPNLTYTYDSRDWYRVNAGWSMNYHEGVRNPPVQGDNRSRSHSATYGLGFTNHRSWKWDLSSGYNFMTERHNDISSRFSWYPNEVFGINQSFRYRVKGKQFSPSNINGFIRSPHIDERTDTYNWFLGFSMDNDIEDHWRTTRFDLTYYKRYKHGWSTEIVGQFRDGTDRPPQLSKSFFSSFVKNIKVRKVNCCTTFEAGYRTGIDEYYLTVYLNALPQYPGDLVLHRLDEDDEEIDFYFPNESLQSDLLTDMFGIESQYVNLFR